VPVPDHRDRRHGCRADREHAGPPARRGRRRSRGRPRPVGLAAGSPGPGVVPADRARGAPPHRAASRRDDDTEYGQPAGPHDRPPVSRPGHRAVVAAGRVESRRGRQDPAARARADGTLHGAVRPDHDRVAAGRHAVALQDRAGNGDPGLVDSAPPGIRHPGIRRVPVRPPGQRPRTLRRARRGAGAHARIPRSRPFPPGQPGRTGRRTSWAHKPA